MTANQTYIEKADMAIADLTSGGLLVAEQAKKFFEILIEDTRLLSIIQTIPMNSPTYELPKMGFTSRVLRGATENAALAVADRSKPTLDKVTLTAKELIAEARIPYGVVEDNIENGTFQDTAMRLLAKAVQRDLEDLIINGDTTSTDPLLKVLDGFLKQATTRVVNAGGVRLSKSTFKTMMQTMPSQFLDGIAFTSSKNAIIDYVDSLSNRNTPLGDKNVVEKAAAEYMGAPVMWVPKFPENLGGATNKTNVIMTDPKNMVLGIHREITVETDKDITARQYIVVATMRVDAKYQHEPAVVKATEVLASAG